MQSSGDFRVSDRLGIYFGHNDFVRKICKFFFFIFLPQLF